MLRSEVEQGQDIPLWGGVFVYEAPVTYYQKVSLDLRSATETRIFIFFSDKYFTAQQGNSCEFRRALVAWGPLFRI